MSFSDAELTNQWNSLCSFIQSNVGKKPNDLNSVLFLIGIQELGKGKKNFSKEQKQDILHIAVCKLLSFLGYYRLEGTDADGWPHWELLKPIPHVDLLSQENLLKQLAIRYFKEEVGVHL